MIVLLACAPLLAPSAAGAPPPPPAPQEARASFDHSHAKLAAVLEQHVVDGRVRYAALAAHKADLEAYLAELAAVTPEAARRWTREQELAFWINAYNAYTLWLVVENYPIKTIQDLGTLLTRVWEREFIPLESLHPAASGAKLSLEDLEHQILRAKFRDARVHVAIHRASESSPPLRGEPYVAERLDAQLDDQARHWIADPWLQRFQPDENAMQVSEIFDWFSADFERDAGSVQAWIARYAPSEVAAWLGDAKDVRLGYLDFSWKLDEARPGR